MQLTEKQKSEGWRIVKFSEIAKSVSKRVEPGSTDLEIYVGLEHLDPDNLRITRRGVPSDVTGQKLRVRPGQIIFGKRRAYQRKVAVADFEGICSAHAMVLEAIPETVAAEYLPFFMQSDMFMERAIAISEGSLSPTIKWKTLANQEFPLPPRPRQEEILKVLKDTESLKNQTEDLIETGLKTFRVLCRNTLKIAPQQHEKMAPSEGWKIKKLEDIAKVERGKFTPRPRNNPIYYDGEYPFVQTGDIKGAFVYLDKHSQTLNKKGLAVSKLFPKDTILITIAANIGDVALTTYDVACTDSVVAIRPENDIEPLWLLFYLMTLQQYLDSIATESAQKNINLQVLRPLKIHVPPRELQKQSSEKLKSFFETIKTYQRHLNDIKKMQKFILFEELS